MNTMQIEERERQLQLSDRAGINLNRPNRTYRLIDSAFLQPDRAVR